jgi:hypothetical protein
MSGQFQTSVLTVTKWMSPASQLYHRLSPEAKEPAGLAPELLAAKLNPAKRRE